VGPGAIRAGEAEACCLAAGGVCVYRHSTPDCC
jgi:hypothetical protein